MKICTAVLDVSRSQALTKGISLINGPPKRGNSTDHYQKLIRSYLSKDKHFYEVWWNLDQRFMSYCDNRCPRTDDRTDVYCEFMQIAREDSCSAVYSSYVIIINSILSNSRAVCCAQCVHWNLSILWYRGTFR